MGKLRLGLLFGGRSVEHEVSIVSATSILGALDRARYDVSLIGVDHEGRWHLAPPTTPLPDVMNTEEVLLRPAPGGPTLVSSRGEAAATLDVILPIIHGKGGEDGALQGLLELADVPYVGSGVLSSSLQMDKDLSKKLLEVAGLPVVPWVTFGAEDLKPDRIPESAERAIEALGERLFVKPANSGSSVGIHLTEDMKQLVDAIADARRYDVKVLVEQAVDAREVEVAVLGNDRPEASVPGEIRTTARFYDYEAKYADDATELVIPAEVSLDESERIRALAIRAFEALDARGLARVDFLMRRSDGELFLNELNSLPGFTAGSMYPKLWEATGLPYTELLDRLVNLALERHAQTSQLETHFRG